MKKTKKKIQNRLYAVIQVSCLLHEIFFLLWKEPLKNMLKVKFVEVFSQFFVVAFNFFI